MTDNTHQLLPCPFCGGEASSEGYRRYSKPLEDTNWEDGSEITECFYVNCIHCGIQNGCAGLVQGYQTKAEAIKRWNTRNHPTQSGLADELERDIELAEADGNSIVVWTPSRAKEILSALRSQTPTEGLAGYLFEPSDEERSQWPEATETYVKGLEAAHEEATARLSHDVEPVAWLYEVRLVVPNRAFPWRTVVSTTDPSARKQPKGYEKRNAQPLYTHPPYKGKDDDHHTPTN